MTFESLTESIKLGQLLHMEYYFYHRIQKPSKHNQIFVTNHTLNDNSKELVRY